MSNDEKKSKPIYTVDPHTVEILNFGPRSQKIDLPTQDKLIMPPEKKTLLSSQQELLNHSTHQEINFFHNHNFRLLLWNIHKAKHIKIEHDIKNLVSQSELVVLQEVITSPEVIELLKTSHPQMGWSFAKSFQRRSGDSTGVATGSIISPHEERGYKSMVHEPILKTPKTILVSKYNILNSSEQLLVANIHGINFVSTEKFKNQIHQLVEKIKTHKGPLLVAGDFNCWNPMRLTHLLNQMKLLQLEIMEYPYFRFLALDHIFTRGIKIKKIHNLSHIRTSDHKPVMVDLEILKSNNI